MFDIGWAEMMVIAVVAIVVVGPKELPGMLRTFGKTMGKVRRMSRDFQRQFDDALKEADLDDVRKGIETVKKANPTHALKQAMAPVKDEMTEVATSAKKPVVAKGRAETPTKTSADPPETKATAAEASGGDAPAKPAPPAAKSDVPEQAA